MASIVYESEEILVNCISFEWKIPHFFPLKDMNYKSPPLHYLGTNWHIFLSKFGDYWDIGICNEEGSSSNRWAYFTMGIKKKDGTTYKPFSGIMLANANNAPWEFLEDSDLLRHKMRIAPQDELVIFCNISLEKDFFTSKSQQDVHTDSIYKVSDDLRSLLLNGNDFDTTINIGNKEYKVHRAILGARSLVFQKMFAHDTSERNTGKVEIQDCDPEVFEDFLVFLYSGKVDGLSTEKVMGLYALADKYDVQDAKKEYLYFMAHNLFVDNFCDIATLALKYNERELLESATDFFTKNTREIITSAQWQCFHKLYPVESNELYIEAVDYMMNQAQKN